MDGRPSRKGGQNPAYRPSRRLHSWANPRPAAPAPCTRPSGPSGPLAPPRALAPRAFAAPTRRGINVFTGEYRHTIDGKGRVAVPARFRAQLDDGAFVSRWLDNCLAIFPRAAWDDLAAKVAALPTGNASAREFGRFLFGSAFEVELDAQGRLLLPATLRSWSQLEGEAMVVGARDHAEIWTPTRWDVYRGSMESSDALAAQLEGLGF